MSNVQPIHVESQTRHKNVFCALAAAQLEFGTVSKGSVNPAFKSKYADLADVAGAVIPVLARHGVCVSHYFTGETLSAMRTEFVHGESDTRIACDVPLIVDRQNMQGMKSATTYAKRIGLESLSGVAPEDDDGNAAAKAPPRPAAIGADDDLPAFDAAACRDRLLAAIAKRKTKQELSELWGAETDALGSLKNADAAKFADVKAAFAKAAEAAKPADLGGDEIPY